MRSTIPIRPRTLRRKRDTQGFTREEAIRLRNKDFLYDDVVRRLPVALIAAKYNVSEDTVRRGIEAARRIDGAIADAAIP